MHIDAISMVLSILYYKWMLFKMYIKGCISFPGYCFILANSVGPEELPPNSNIMGFFLFNSLNKCNCWGFLQKKLEFFNLKSIRSVRPCFFPKICFVKLYFTILTEGDILDTYP